MVESCVGPYRILEKLGSGGMGDVYLAEDTRLKRKVALKSLSETWLQRSGARERLLREARAAAILNHPNIAAIHDIVEAGDRAHIVMEYVEGESLSRRLSRGRLSAEDATAIAIQLCDAMAAAHAQGIIHRDLKPGNVSLTRDGKVKVLDFGLATSPPGLAEAHAVSSSDTTPSDSERLLGTPAYMAPEQLRRRPVDERTDVYGVGVMLYELLTGRRPFGGEGVVELGMAILNEATPTATQAEPSVPAGLSAIVARAMAREPSERFQSALEMREALRRLPPSLSDAPTLSAAFPWDARTARTLASVRSRPVVATLGVAGAAILGLVAYKWLRPPSQAAPSAEKPPVVAVLPLANVGGTPEDDYLGVGVADTLITHLAGLPGVTVVSRAATQDYRGRLPDTRRLARDLGLTYVVSGGVQRAGERLRVTLNLVRPDDSVAWGQEYEGAIENIFRLQSEVAAGLSAALRVTLTPAERSRLTRPPTSDAVAFADYSRARSLLERPDVEGNLDKAVALFEAATRTDPRFALAHAGLGEACWVLYEETRDPRWPPKALAATTEALRLDPDLPAVRVSLAIIYQGTGKLQEAAEELRRVLTLQPGNDDAHRLLGDILGEQGQIEEGIAELRAALALRPGYWRNQSFLGYALLKSGRYSEAAAAYRRVTELQPDNPRGFQMLGTAHQLAGDYPQALAQYERSLELGGDSKSHTNIGTIHYAQGRYAEAATAFARAAGLEPASALAQRNLGDAYAKLGEAGKARTAYEQAVKLSEEQLEVNPMDANRLAWLAVYEAKLGRHALAARDCARALALEASDGEVHFASAVVHALAGRTSDALASLEQALDRGYSASLAREDDDLVTIRDTRQFRRLLSLHSKPPQ